jgi:phosphoglycerate kinase
MSVNENGGAKPTTDPTDVFGNIEDLDARGRRVFLRVDPYVLDSLGTQSPPESEKPPGAIESSLRRLLELDARVIIGTHFSPEASAETGLVDVEALASELSDRLAVEVLMPDEPVGDAALRVLHELRQGQLCVLPDLLAARGGGEQKNDEAFARALGAHVDAYVFDAFSASHLEYASLVRLPRLAPRRALGAHARRELRGLSDIFSLSRGSVGMALGGQKFADKFDTLGGWLPRINTLCVGGTVATTLLGAAGALRDDAITEGDRLAQARSLISRARDLGVKVLLPSDFRVQMDGDRDSRVVSPRNVSAQCRIIDIGPESCARFSEALGQSQNLLWWGPLGNVQHPHGSTSSAALGQVCATPTIRSVVLGGDTRRFVRQLPPEVVAGIDLISTGSAAAKALLSGRRLPALEALRVRH